MIENKELRTLINIILFIFGGTLLYVGITDYIHHGTRFPSMDNLNLKTFLIALKDFAISTSFGFAMFVYVLSNDLYKRSI